MEKSLERDYQMEPGAETLSYRSILYTFYILSQQMGEFFLSWFYMKEIIFLYTFNTYLQKSEDKFVT